jgi:phosphinothricin acetyltransferase
MPDFQIRPATLADIPAIAAIYKHAVLHGTATFEIDPPDIGEMARRFEAITKDRGPYLVATRNETIAGYAYAGTYRPRPAYRFTVEDSIYLAPESQKRGIGSALLNELIARAEKEGFRQMIAVIGDSANAGSVAVHARAGFEMIGTHPNVGFKFGRWLDTVMMQRALGDGANTTP